MGSGGSGGPDADQDGVPDSEDDFPSEFGKSTFISNFRLAGKGTKSTEVDPPSGASIAVRINLGIQGGDTVTVMVFGRESLTESTEQPSPRFKRTIDATKGMGGKDDLEIPPDAIPEGTALLVFEPASEAVEIEVKGTVYK